MAKDRLYQMIKKRSRKSGLFQHDCFLALNCRQMTSQMRSITLRSVALGVQNLNFNYVPGITPARLKSCEMERCPALKPHLHLGRQRPCKCVTCLQWCPDSRRPSWSVLPEPHGSIPWERSLEHNIATTCLCMTYCLMRSNSSSEKRRTLTPQLTCWRRYRDSTDQATLCQ